VNLIVIRQDYRMQLQSLAIKIATLCILTQPFFHKSSARYWVELAPWAAWAMALMICLLTKAPPSPCRRLERSQRWLSRAQLLYAGCFVVTASAIMLA